MIKLDTYERCQDCHYFDAKTNMVTLSIPYEKISTIANVVCSNQELCDHLLHYLQFCLERPQPAEPRE